MTEIEYAATPAGDLAYVRRSPAADTAVDAADHAADHAAVPAEPLLLIMGVAGHHEMWHEDFVARLAERFDVVAFDHRGIGSSHRAEAGFTVPDLAADASYVLDHLGWDSAHVVGISMGGTVAQELALTRPERVRTLTLGCTWPGPGEVWGPGVAMIAEGATSGDAEKAARLMFEGNLSARYAEDPAHFTAFVTAAAAHKVPGPVVVLQMQAAGAHDAVERLAGLDVPTLVQHGTEDAVILYGAGERLAALVPGATLSTFEGAGHLYFWEEPLRAADEIAAHALG